VVLTLKTAVLLFHSVSLVLAHLNLIKIHVLETRKPSDKILGQ